MHPALHRQRRQIIANGRRRTQRDGIDRGFAGQQGIQRGIPRRIQARIVTADQSGEREIGAGNNYRQMLVAGDLANPDHRDADGHSTFTVTACASARVNLLRSGKANGAASISKWSPSSVRTSSENDSVAVPKKCTCTSPGRRNRSYLK